LSAGAPTGLAWRSENLPKNDDNTAVIDGLDDTYTVEVLEVTY
jgi:hypothetical protein